MREQEPLGKRIRTLLFDMDNTLFDLVEAQIFSCREVTRLLGRDEGETLFKYFLRPIRGFEAHENILDYMKDRQIPDDGRYSESCRLYETAKLRHITPYEGVLSTLESLREDGYRMGIVTDAHSRDATRRLEKTGLLPYFDGMVTCDMVRVKKPAREPFLFALEMLKSDFCETLIIGDSPRRDLEPCRQLGITTVYARYGDRFSRTRNYAGADFCIDSMDQLQGILDRVGMPGP
ncbi:HAD family hydrolase [uncultured Methanoregula sp.]|uniref:HAD family hydrolase n=1 Tax=uncultured Methanoregula sp. TaxID=1005933 RepID=UPI003748E888